MEEKIVVITGASSGIGAAAAARLTQDGMTAVLVARRRDALEAVAATCQGRGHVVTADMTARAEVKRVVDETLGRFGRIDVWINNAGRGITRMPSALTDEDVDEMMRVNVMSALYGMQEVLPHFKSRNDGHVINVSSMLGRIPYAIFRSAYCGAKHFLDALTAMMRDEVHQTHPGIQISLVSPGVVRTEFGLNARHGGVDSRQLPGSQSAEEVAEVLAAVIASREADVYTRPGSQQQVAEYYARVGVDAEVARPAAGRK
ncbi:MAG TPA: SDR family NAD(P)-dependent oxidoreductase [Vicinamibacterales bacterium]|nr:SDR family NAD(P)-dependent oxidoreductase [Vicinamibacterales bacterium]